MPLQSHFYTDCIEAGCDEAGRGCLAGSVYAAAVILPSDYDNPLLNDSKQFFWVLNVDKAVRAIVRAIDRRKGVATITRRWALLAPFMKAAPEWLLVKVLGGSRSTK